MPPQPPIAHLSLALLLARVSLMQSFRRSGLGPLWSTVGVLFTVGAVGLLFGTILRRQLSGFEDYISSLGAGLVMWAFLSAVANESSIAFARWLSILRHSSISFPVISLSILIRHLPILALNIAILLTALAWDHGINPAPLQLLGALLLLVVNVAWIGALALVLGARFRDIGQLVPSIMQITFLLTPILWPSYFLGRFEYLLLFNPFYYLFSVFTSATVGTAIPTFHWVITLIMAVAGSTLTLGVYRWSYRRWPYWI